MNGDLEITVEVELFGHLARVAGADKISLSVSLSLPLGQLSSILIKKFGSEVQPDLFDTQNRSAVATLVNQKFASPETELQDGDVVTLLPILAGG